jgi:hypothetical protein
VHPRHNPYETYLRNQDVPYYHAYTAPQDTKSTPTSASTQISPFYNPNMDPSPAHIAYLHIDQ